MPIILECPQCRKRYTLKNETGADRKYSCKSCGAELKAVSGETRQSEAPPSAGAPSGPDDRPADVQAALNSGADKIAEKYVTIRKLGQGGMGAVYKAWDITLRRYVAIKMILPAIAEASRAGDSQDDTLARFIHEAQTAAKLIHPNILQVYEVGKHQNNDYIAMEFVNGGSLEDYWDKKQGGDINEDMRPRCLPADIGSHRPLRSVNKSDIKEYIILMRDVIKGVDYAHRYNIIHRDIKPANILLSGNRQDDLTPKISDFGLAKEVISDKRLTAAGTVVGTPVFMSPEQATAATLDSRSDIFSLGSVLYKLCTGQEPFSGKSSLDVLKAVVNKEPMPPKSVNPAIDKDLEIIILKAMEKEPERRYTTAQDLADDLDRFLKGEPIKARPASLIYKVTKQVKRNKMAVASLCAVALIIIAVLAGLWLNSANRRQKAQDYLKQADESYAKKDYKQANEYYIKYLELAAGDDAIRQKQAECANRMGSTRLIIRETVDTKSLLEKAELEQVNTVWLNAGPVLQGFYRKNPDMAGLWKGVDESIELLSQSVSRCPTAMGYFYRSMLYREKRRLEDAELDLTKAIKLKPDFDLAYIMRGIIYFEVYDDKIILNTESMNPMEKEEISEVLETAAAADFARIKDAAKIPEQFERYRTLFEAVRFFNKDRPKCIQLLEAGCEKHKSAEEFPFWLAVASHSSDMPKSEEFIAQALDIKPQYAEAYLLRGTLKSRKGDIDGSIADLNKIIAINPNYASAYYNRGVQRSVRGDTDGAFSDYSETIRLDPNYTRAYNNRGNIRYKKCELDGAIDDFNAALRISSDSPEAAVVYVNRGNTLSAKGRIDDALKDYERAIRLNPGYAKAYCYRAEIRARRGDIKGAVEDYSAAIKANPDLFEPYINRGNMRTSLGDLDGAMADHNKAIQLKPDSPAAYYNRGVTWQAKGDPAMAIDDYTRAIELKPDFASAYSNRGSSKLETGDMDGAIEDFNQAIRINPADSIGYFNRGVAKSGKGDVDGAIEDYSRAIRLKPDYFEAYYNRGIRFYNTNEKYAEALADMLKAVELNPKLKAELGPLIEEMKDKVKDKK